MSLPRVLLVDDHKVVVEGLVRLLSGRFDVVDTITDGRVVLDAVLRLRPELLLLDLSMPNMGGLEALRQIGARGLEVKSIVLTMHADARLAVEALKAGASGFVLKEASGEELLKALQAVLTGQTYLASALTKEVLTLMVSPEDTHPGDLTTQQREVLRLLVNGHRAKEVAAILGLSTRTVEGIKYKSGGRAAAARPGQLKIF
jgi:DNA-binding NarL/FixJ family response regulator